MYQADIETVKHIIYGWIARQATPTGLVWLDGKIKQQKADSSTRDLFMVFGATPRFLGKQPLRLYDEDMQNANRLRPGWNPQGWSIDQATRILFVLMLPHVDTEQYLQTLAQLFDGAEVAELTALYAALPLLPYPERWVTRAAEGIRSNMTVVFNTVALDNPFCADYLPEGAWNQLVLKAVFVGSPLYRIWGFDSRRNPALALMLYQYARERRAASRPITPELWRAIGPFISAESFQDLTSFFEQGPAQRQAAIALAFSESKMPEAQAFLRAHPALESSIANNQISWHSIGRQIIT